MSHLTSQSGLGLFLGLALKRQRFFDLLFATHAAIDLGFGLR
jgi:hypothetical protein